MAIDSAEKRKAAAFLLFIPVVTNNSGQDEEWRKQALGTYSGIASGGGGDPVLAIVPSNIFIFQAAV